MSHPTNQRNLSKFGVGENSGGIQPSNVAAGALSQEARDVIKHTMQ